MLSVPQAIPSVRAGPRRNSAKTVSTGSRLAGEKVHRLWEARVKRVFGPDLRLVQNPDHADHRFRWMPSPCSGKEKLIQ